MAKKAKDLKALEVARLTNSGVHAVGTVPGLYLQVLPSGARTWILRVMVAGKRREMGLGGYPAVTLADAHEAARRAREKIRDGIDPIADRQAARGALIASRASEKTFQQCAEAYIAAHEAGWKSGKHAQQWTNTLSTYVYPVCGSLLVSDIGLPHVLQVLEPIWTTKTETATRVRSRIELVLDWATARGYRHGLNPARWRGHLDKLLPKPKRVTKVIHHAAMPYSDVGSFMKALRKSEGISARALEFAILTACRSGEVRLATWDEINFRTGVWTIPAERMKGGKEHRVPLSKEAVSVLKRLQRLDDSPWLFSSTGRAPLSDMSLSAVLRRLKLDATVHGFRSTFRDWAGEQTNFAREVCEHALAHQLRDKAEAAYQRGDLFVKRAHLMSEWAQFCAKDATKAKVVPIKRHAKGRE